MIYDVTLSLIITWLWGHTTSWWHPVFAVAAIFVSTSGISGDLLVCPCVKQLDTFFWDKKTWFWPTHALSFQHQHRCISFQSWTVMFFWRLGKEKKNNLKESVFCGNLFFLYWKEFANYNWHVLCFYVDLKSFTSQSNSQDTHSLRCWLDNLL